MVCCGSKIPEDDEDLVSVGADQAEPDDKSAPPALSGEDKPSNERPEQPTAVIPERFKLSSYREGPMTDGLTFRVKEILERRNKTYPEFQKPAENASRVKDLENKLAYASTELAKLKTENARLTEEVTRFKEDLDKLPRPELKESSSVPETQEVVFRSDPSVEFRT